MCFLDYKHVIWYNVLRLPGFMLIVLLVLDEQASGVQQKAQRPLGHG